jgi:ornithine cyclodeaminase/alanine dehydrogenase-like protein (mu-crystallin family)
MASDPSIVTIPEQQVLELLPMQLAIDALALALLEGLAPEETPARSEVPLQAGSMLLMPGEFGRYAGVKILTVASDGVPAEVPRIQGNFLLIDAQTLRTLALIDGAALTSLRTPALSAVAVDRLAAPSASTLAVFGTGPQARAHVEAIACVRALERVLVMGHTPEKTARFVDELRLSGYPADDSEPSAVAEAEIIACCTTAREPLFDGSLVRDDAVVVAVGSHEPDARETDDALARRSTVYVEDAATALREAGDVVMAVASGSLDRSQLHTVAELVVQGAPERSGPAVVKTVGMGWQDMIVASAVYERAQSRRAERLAAADKG